MDERLTPQLRRRVLDLPASDRAALQREIAWSLENPRKAKPETRLRYLADKMKEITGVEVCRNCRIREVVQARNVLIFVARCEGFTLKQLGEFLGRDHAAVSYAEKQMGQAFSLPEAFRDTIELYNNYTKSIL